MLEFEGASLGVMPSDLVDEGEVEVWDRSSTAAGRIEKEMLDGVSEDKAVVGELICSVIESVMVLGAFLTWK